MLDDALDQLDENGDGGSPITDDPQLQAELDSLLEGLKGNLDPQSSDDLKDLLDNIQNDPVFKDVLDLVTPLPEPRLDEYDGDKKEYVRDQLEWKAESEVRQIKMRKMWRSLGLDAKGKYDAEYDKAYGEVFNKSGDAAEAERVARAKVKDLVKRDERKSVEEAWNEEFGSQFCKWTNHWCW